MPRHPHGYIHAKPALLISFLLLLMILPALTDVRSLLEQTVSAATTFTVNSTGDGADSNLADGVCNDGTGACTLRAAIQQANSVSGDDTINFNLPGSNIIKLDTQLEAIGGNLVINGPGANALTVRRSTTGGTPNFRIFTINSGQTVTLSGLTISNGNAAGFGFPADSGGGILNQGTLVVNMSVVSGNRATFGAGVSNSGLMI